MSGATFDGCPNGEPVAARAQVPRCCRARSSARTVLDGRRGGRPARGAVRPRNGRTASSSSPPWPTARPARFAVLADGREPRRSRRSRPTARRPTRSSARSPSSAESCPSGHPWLKPVRFHRSYRPATTRGAGSRARRSRRRRCRLLPRRGRGDPRGRGRAGPRRRHRAGPLPLPVPRRAGLPPGDLARLPAPRRGAGAARRPRQAHDPLIETARRRHDDRPRHRLLPGGRSARRRRGARSGRGACAAIALELERLANHIGDLGALAGDVGVPADRVLLRPHPRRLPQPDRPALRQPLRARPGRPGGVRFDARRRTGSRWLLERLDRRLRGRRAAPSSLLWNTPSVQARFEDTGRSSPETGRGARAGGPRGAGVRRRARRPPRLPLGHLPLRADPGLDLAHRRRLRARLRALARDAAIGRVRSRAARGPAGRRPPRARRRRWRRTRWPSLVGGMARRDLPRRRRPTPEGRFAALQGGRSRRSTTGSAWRWPCASSRSPISRCATRASTCRTAATTCRRVAMLEGPPRPPPTRTPHDRLSRRPASLPDRFRGLPVHRCRALPRGLPRLRRRLPDRRDRRRRPRGSASTWAAVCSASSAQEACPARGPSVHAASIAWRPAPATTSWSDGRRAARGGPGRPRAALCSAGRCSSAQVSAGGCNGCEADSKVLADRRLRPAAVRRSSFVASPRHADGLLVTGPVTENMRQALLETYDAVPAPKLVIAVGACAISGGPFADHPEVEGGATAMVPVDLFVPGCPPHPATLLDGLLRLLGRLPRQR